ncbi:MAG: 4'-phosphopantetheinyl transferase superfamily protein [Alphaproteobacteria bacterium]|nr:4'-phosphopantetheinyl transferase superfamily protein [Alphaproteobacteria bacterium]
MTDLTTPNEASVWVVDLSDVAWQAGAPIDILDADECARAERFRFDLHRDRFVRRRAAFRAILGAATGRDPAQLSYVVGPHGKPALRDSRHADGRALSFNASHSDELAVLAVSFGAPIGIDIERVRGEIVEPSLIERVLTPTERDAVETGAPAARAAAFFTAWARKEAIVKAIGVGLSREVDRIDVAPTRAGPVAWRAPDGTPWWIIDLAIDPRYKSALAAPRSAATITTRRWNPPAER